MSPKDIHKTKVIFRKLKGEVIAFFPDIVEGYGKIAYYTHVGQHGSGEYSSQWPLAKPVEYAPLLVELERIGYNVDVRQRMTSAQRYASVRGVQS